MRNWLGQKRLGFVFGCGVDGREVWLVVMDVLED